MLTSAANDAQFICWLRETNSRRKFERWVLNVPASLTAAGVRHRGAIWDVSPLGALVRLTGSAKLSVGDYVTLTPRGYQAIPGEVRHTLNGGRLVGVMLLHGPSEQDEMATWLNTQRTQIRR